MILLLVAALQTVPVQRTGTIDLTIAQPCDERTGEEVVVCAKRGESPYRLKELPLAQHRLGDAKVQISDGVSAAAETESADVGGFTSNRLMVRFKVKF